MKTKAVLLSVILVYSVFCPIFGLAGRTPLSILALFTAIGITLWGLFEGNIKPIKNRWLLIFIFFLFFSAWQAPKGIIIENGLILANYWVWESLLKITAFLGMYWVIKGTEIDEKNRNIILKTIMWCGFVTALHCIGQSLGFMQWWKVGTHNEALFSPQPGVVGMLGHPTLAGPFMGMIIPIALYFRKWIIAAIIALGVCLTYSYVSIISMGVSLFALAFMVGNKAVKIILPVILIVMIMSCFIFIDHAKIYAFIQKKSSGRITEWKKVIQVIKEPFGNEGDKKKPYSYTGFGIGSFKYIYRNVAKTIFSQAHNDYLEVLWCGGLIGLGLFFTAFAFMILEIDFKLMLNVYLFCGALCMFAAASANFIFQISPQNVFLITILGLLSNKET